MSSVTFFYKILLKVATEKTVTPSFNLQGESRNYIYSIMSLYIYKKHLSFPFYARNCKLNISSA